MLIYRDRLRRVTQSILFFMYFRNTCKRKGKEFCSLFRIVWKAVKLWPEQSDVSYTAARPRWFRANACSKSLQNHINGWHRSCPTLSWCVCQARSVKMLSHCVCQIPSGLSKRQTQIWPILSRHLRYRPVLIWVTVSLHYFGLSFLSSFIFYVLFFIITCRFNSNSLQVTTNCIT